MLFGLNNIEAGKTEFVCLELAGAGLGMGLGKTGRKRRRPSGVDLGNGACCWKGQRYPSHVATENQIVSVEEHDMYWKWKATLLVLKRIQT